MTYYAFDDELSFQARWHLAQRHLSEKWCGRKKNGPGLCYTKGSVLQGFASRLEGFACFFENEEEEEALERFDFTEDALDALDALDASEALDPLDASEL